MADELIREVDLHITNRCNLTCAHCSVDSGRTMWGEMGFEDWVAVVDDAASLGCRFADLTGGEPILHPDVERLISYITGKGLHLELQSNGLLLSPERLRRVWAAGLRTLVISLDGRRERHDRVRGRDGCFEAAVAAIRHSAEMGFKVRVTRVMVTDEDGDDIEEFARELESLGVSHLSINHFSPVTQTHFINLPARAPERWAAFTDSLERLSGSLSFPISYEVGYVHPSEAHSFFDEETRCLIERRRWFLIRSDGQVYPCYHFVHRPEMSLGDVRERPLSELIRDERGWSAYGGLAETPAGCAGCSFSSSCRGGCPSPGYLQIGKLSVKDSRCQVERGFVPVCPFIKRTAGTRHMTNIAPYYYAGTNDARTTSRT
jgi:radical SAM protein with 4Fe4S-binding SPASM domain